MRTTLITYLRASAACLLSTLAVVKPGVKILSDVNVCNLKKPQFLYSTEYIQLSVIMHFILTVTSLTQFCSPGALLQFEEMDA